MIKLLYITCIFLLTNSNVFGQVAYATASATIVTPVGAEISGDINFGDFSTGSSHGTIAPGSDGMAKSTGGVKLVKDKTGAVSLNVIGGSFAYDVTIQTEPIILKRKTGSETMKVNLFTGLHLVKNVQNNDIVNLPVSASLAVEASQAPGMYASSFSITVNFN